MNEDTKRQANEVFQRKLAELDGARAKSKANEEDMPRSLTAFDLSGDSVCELAPKIINTIQKLISTFSWLIPDRIENPALAFLAAAETVIMPAFCGTAAATATAAGPTAAKTNFGPKKS